jgi:hypothetical protein
LISHAYRCIFIHIPRTGGSSVETVLWPGERTEADLWMGFTTPFGNRYQTGGLQHLTALHVREAVGAQTFDAYLKFAIVRNPWDKAVSQYAFMRRRPDLRELLGMQQDDDFRTYLRLIQSAPHVQWQPQRSFVCDERGESMIDHTLRYEEFDKSVASMLQRLGVDAPVPHVHGAERGQTADYYDDETRAMVANHYRDDIAYFAYSFPSE